MARRAGPPEGDTPGGDDDEFRSTVFDESFIQAARLREFSAKERLDEHERPVSDAPPAPRRSRSPHGATALGTGRGRGVSGQFVGLLLVIVLAFGAAIYMGASGPYQQSPDSRPPDLLRSTVVPLVPRGVVPGAAEAELFLNSPAADFATSTDLLPLPEAEPTRHFDGKSVYAALNNARHYVLVSSTSPEVLTGRSSERVREVITTSQRPQFDRSLQNPSADGRHEATGWAVRFHPDEARLADSRVRVRGTFAVSEADSSALEVTARHVLVYALRPAGSEDTADASLFTVRREVRMRFTSREIKTGTVILTQTTTQAGPLPCAEDTHDWLRPLLAGEDVGADGSTGTDPYATDMRRTALCGVLARSAQPDLD